MITDISGKSDLKARKKIFTNNIPGLGSAGSLNRSRGY